MTTESVRERLARLSYEFALAIIRAAERRFQRSGCTAFPTVRELARSCRCKQGDVEAACEDTALACLQGYNIEGWTLGDLEVYVFEDHPDAN